MKENKLIEFWSKSDYKDRIGFLEFLCLTYNKQLKRIIDVIMTEQNGKQKF